MARLPAAALGAVASGFPHYYSLASLWQSAFVVLLLAPLLVLVAIKARAGAATKLMSPNRPHIRGRYRTWDDHCMECAMVELTAAADFKNGKTFNLRATAKKWGIPEATLRGYFHSESGMRCSNAGRAPVLSRQEEEEVVQRIMQQHANGLSLNHRQVKWLLMEIVRRVPGKQDTQSGKAWLKNGAPGYTWYRRFLNRHHDRIRARVVDNLDPKRWFVTYKDCIDFSMVSSDIYQAASSCGSVQEQAGNNSSGDRMWCWRCVGTEEELELESEILRLEREAEQKRRRINQIRLQREQDATEWQISVSTLCDDMGRSQAQQAAAAKARKRRRLNTRGTGALVLNSDEEVAAAQAREELRRRRSALKSDIKASKTELRAARAEANKARKEVLKFVAAAVTQAGKARTQADKTAEAAEAADKAAAEKACAQAGKAAAAAAEKAAASRSAVPRLAEALAATIAGIAKVAEAEYILKTIEEYASSGAQPEDEEEDEVEVMDDDDDDAEEPQEGSGTSGAADPTAQLESAKERVEQAVESSLEAAGDAARSTQSLQLARERTMSATGDDVFLADAGMEDSVPAGERAGAGDGAGVGSTHTTPPTCHSSRRPPRPPATSASSDRVEPQPIVVDPEADEPDDNADEPHFRCRLEMLVRNHKKNWVHSQKRGPEWAFYVPRHPPPPDCDETVYKAGDMHVECFLCHAAKQGRLHSQFPAAPDEETQAHDDEVSFWAPPIPRTKDGTHAKHTIFYQSKNGNNSLRKHLRVYHSEEFKY
eukprot:jgi/Tetstr1/428797/TSEL_018784.t1